MGISPLFTGIKLPIESPRLFLSHQFFLSVVHLLPFYTIINIPPHIKFLYIKKKIVFLYISRNFCHHGCIIRSLRKCDILVYVWTEWQVLVIVSIVRMNGSWFKLARSKIVNDDQHLPPLSLALCQKQCILLNKQFFFVCCLCHSALTLLRIFASCSIVENIKQRVEED